MVDSEIMVCIYIYHYNIVKYGRYMIYHCYIYIYLSYMLIMVYAPKYGVLKPQWVYQNDLTSWII